MAGMRVALVQLASSTDSAANRALVEARLAGLDGSSDLVVMPEATMHDFGTPDHDLASAAEPLDGPFVATLAEQARRLDATVVAGMFERPGLDGRGDLPFNTLVVVASDGSLAATYRKIHLYDSFGYRESERLSAGGVEPVVIDVAGVRTGLMTCYDLRFPEMGRALVDAGAELFVVPAAWVAGDAVYGHHPALRRWLEARGQPYVLAVPANEPLALAGVAGPHASTAAAVAALPAGRWARLSAGDGSKGPRLYDWARVPLARPEASGLDHWLLVRRSLADPHELAYYLVAAPPGTPLAALARVAGRRWAVEESLQIAKGEVGLDHYEVRRWDGWYRHITLALFAQAFLTVVRARATAGGPEKGGPSCWRSP